MRTLLNLREAGGVKYAINLYKKRIGSAATSDDDLVIFLGDTPSKRLCWSATSRKIPTFRRNNGKMWHVRSQSWLTSRERLACLGFPVTQSCAESMGVPMIPVRDHMRNASVAGNSFHFSTVACVQLVALSCYRMVPPLAEPWLLVFYEMAMNHNKTFKLKPLHCDRHPIHADLKHDLKDHSSNMAQWRNFSQSMTWSLSPTEKDFSFQNCTVRWYLDLTISHRFGTHLHHNKKHNEPTSEKRIIEGYLLLFGTPNQQENYNLNSESSHVSFGKSCHLCSAFYHSTTSSAQVIQFDWSQGNWELWAMVVHSKHATSTSRPIRKRPRGKSAKGEDDDVPPPRVRPKHTILQSSESSDEDLLLSANIRGIHQVPLTLGQYSGFVNMLSLMGFHLIISKENLANQYVSIYGGWLQGWWTDYLIRENTLKNINCCKCVFDWCWSKIVSFRLACPKTQSNLGVASPRENY